MNLKPDQLQNELILVSHHVSDAMSALERGDADYAKRSLADVRASIHRLQGFLKPQQATELDRIAESMDAEWWRY